MASQTQAAPTASEPAPPSRSPVPRSTAGGFRATRDLLHPARSRTLTDNEIEAVDEVRSLARDYDGTPEMLGVIRRTTSGKQRNFAVRRTAPEHPDFPALMGLIDDLVRSSGDVTITRSGLFPTAELRAECARIVREDGQEIICLPIRQPWILRPDKSRAVDPEGVRGDPIYRAKADRCPIYTTFRAGAAEETLPESREWWQEPDEGG